MDELGGRPIPKCWAAYIVTACFLLVRHGETAANVDGLMLGRADPPLTDRGVAQARALAEALPMEVDQRWIELDYGEFDGRSLSSRTAVMWDRWRSDPSVAPEGGDP